MKKLLTATAIGLALLTWHTSCTQQPKAPEAFTPIKVETPARPAGQEDVIQLVTPKIDTVRVGFIGLGMRGPGAVARWTHIPGTKIVALCDLLPERVEKSQEILKNAGLPEVASYSGSEEAWKQLCERDDIDLVYIATDWKHHAAMLQSGRYMDCREVCRRGSAGGCRKRIYAYDVFKFDPDRHVYGERSAFFNLLWPKSVKKTKRIYCFIVCAYFFSDSDFDDCFICVP